MEQHSFSIYNFGQALEHLIIGKDIEREGRIRLRLVDNTIMMIMNNDEICPWLPVHKDILATDWKVITRG